MKIKVILSTVLLVLLGSGVLWAGDPWKEKPWTEWTEQDVEKVLKSSPWARQVSVPSGIRTKEVREPWPTGHPPTPSLPDDYPVRRVSRAEYRTVTVLWLSSRTVREAIVRYWQLRGRVTEEAARRFASGKSNHYRIGVHLGFPRAGIIMQPVWLSEDDVEEVRQSAYLEAKHSKKKLLPVTVEVVGESLAPAAGFLVYFPLEAEGEAVLGPNVKKVTFHCKFRNATIKKSFDLRKMVRDGKPDL